MVHICAIVGCSSKANRAAGAKLSFYRFPKVCLRSSKEVQELQRKRRIAWMATLRQKDITEPKLENMRVCSQHFFSGKPADLHDINNPDWAPSSNLGFKTSKGKTQKDWERHQRAVKRSSVLPEAEPQFESVIIVQHPVDSSVGYAVSNITNEDYHENMEHDYANMACLQVVEVQPTVNCVNINEEGTQTDLTMEYIKLLESELLARNENVYELRDQVAKLTLSKDLLEERKDMLVYYTGLPDMQMFTSVLNAISAELAKSALSPYHQLLITFMKLRLNLTFLGLSYRFNVSKFVITRAFQSVIELIKVHFQYFVQWPDRDCLEDTMPSAFKKHFTDQAVVIIDFFEVPVQKNVRKDTWCEERKKHTIKYLIGITPEGVISFISEGYGGAVSDEDVISESGILQNLQLGDVILNNRVPSNNNSYFAYVVEPTANEEDLELNLFDDERARRISPLRNHIQKIVKNIKSRFSVMNGPVPAQLVFVKNDKCLLDDISKVCCILINMCPSFAPLTELPA